MLACGGFPRGDVSLRHPFGIQQNAHRLPGCSVHFLAHQLTLDDDERDDIHRRLLRDHAAVEIQLHPIEDHLREQAASGMQDEGIGRFVTGGVVRFAAERQFHGRHLRAQAQMEQFRLPQCDQGQPRLVIYPGLLAKVDRQIHLSDPPIAGADIGGGTAQREQIGGPCLVGRVKEIGLFAKGRGDEIMAVAGGTSGRFRTIPAQLPQGLFHHCATGRLLSENSRQAMNQTERWNHEEKPTAPSRLHPHGVLPQNLHKFHYIEARATRAGCAAFAAPAILQIDPQNEI